MDRQPPRRLSSAGVTAWQFVEATERERGALGSVESVLDGPHALAAPANRYRRVLRIERDGQTYYVKCFAKTQLKNRVQFAVTRPRAASDAQRELGVARALRAAGVATARPVAIARRGAASYYVCAALPGETLRDRIAHRPADDCVRGAVIRLITRITAAGIVLPDMSADHVFLTGPAPDALAVIDLHNGRLARRPRRRDGRRILRRFRTSVRGLAVPDRVALAFAVRLLRALGLARSVRRQLLAQSGGRRDTHSRYDAQGKSRAYRHRNPKRHARELARLAAVWPGATGDTVLDAPCGAGRVAGWLRAQGATPYGVDRSIAMLREARAAQPALPVALGDAQELPLADRTVDGVVLFRFLHHLPPPAAQRALAEASRVARRYVVVSFFHPASAHGIRRWLRHRFAGAERTRHSLTRRKLRTWMAAHGFRPTAWRAEAAWRRELWIAAFERQAASADDE